MSTCAHCNADIILAKTRRGRLLPLDPAPVAVGNVRIIDGIAVVDSRSTIMEPGDRYIAHIVTCPNYQALQGRSLRGRPRGRG